MKVKVVTSFSQKDWANHGPKFIESFCQYWPSDTFLDVYVDPPVIEGGPFLQYPNVRLKVLDDPDLLAFKKKYPHANGMEQGQYNYRKDAIKFSHKAFCLTGCETKGFKYLIWLDSDIEIFDHVTERDLLDWTQDQDIVHLGRIDIDYSETGFLAFKVGHPKVRQFLSKVRNLYTTGELFNYAQWTDAFVITRLINLYEGPVLNLSEGMKGLAVFEQTGLGKGMRHHKGPTGKATLFGKGMRYDALSDLIRTYRPTKIVETGTWNGDRALQMAEAVFSYQDSCTYVGFDLFEEADEVTDKRENNVKKHYSLGMVTSKLASFQGEMAKVGKKFQFTLVKGDTNRTLAESFSILAGADFAFIDGGHSEETVTNDYVHLKAVPVLVFDDFYVADEKGLLPSLRCVNELLVREGLKFSIVPSADKVQGGGIVHLAVILKEGMQVPSFVRPFRVQPRDCVPKDDIKENIIENMKLIDTWITKCQPHGETAILASAGPSLEESISKIRSIDGRIFCVKHSLPTLIKNGIHPFGCVLLDPREITGTSTHGIVRTTLFDEATKDTIFFIASMSHPSVTRYLLDKGLRVVGWHAMTSALEGITLPDGTPLVQGGTCAAFRSVGLGHLLGFRKYEMFGYDLAYHEPSEDEKKLKMENGLPKFLQVQVGPDRKKFWTSGELVAAAQDAETLFKSQAMDCTFHVHGDGIVPIIAQVVGLKPLPEYRLLYG